MLNLINRNNAHDNLLSSVVSNWDDFFPSVRHSSFLNTASRIPAVDVKETDDAFQFIADLPGVSKDNLEVSVKNDVLSLTVRSQNEKSEESEGRLIRQERYRGEFQRSFKLNEMVDGEHIQATYKDGVLSISVPKKEPAQLRKIEVVEH